MNNILILLLPPPPPLTTTSTPTTNYYYYYYYYYRCVEEKLDSWMEADGTRTMALQGVVYNNGSAEVCSISVSMVS